MDPNFYVTARVPPVPDPQTGEPWPPRAPLLGGAQPKPAGDVDRIPEHLASPPEDQGPVLARYVHTFRWEKGAALYGLLVGGALTLGDLLFGGEGSVGWFLGLLLAGWSVWEQYRHRGSSATAGAEWLRNQHGWVRVNELVRIGMSVWRAPGELLLEDRDGRSLRISAREVVASQQLWDLVYNGMRRSIVLGAAEIDRGVWQFLQLPDRR
ncbi:hypothetical protein IQ251_11820 [Saccharopolyspora sp. HNM0983]|uniref:Uncharacterized protein n=1 Tax=Saccharopolyspora montiporae TaxID=2781240 RepID=A0A929G0A0_9PSEU|nr:hypothetical protein [Saccharopolyspora sp. HNM0983]MBE9375129.1 hypothetical protein [Saccharopolyspora sp. HNM0983]